MKHKACYLKGDQSDEKETAQDDEENEKGEIGTMPETKEEYTGVKYIQGENYVDPHGNVLGPAPKKELEVNPPVAQPVAPVTPSPTPDVAVKEKK